MRESYPRKFLADLASEVRYGYTASASSDPIGPKFLRITDIVPNTIDWSAVPYCSIDESELWKYLLRDGDIVIARTGATVGYAKVLRKPPHCVFASYLVRVRLAPDCDELFVGQIVTSAAYKEFIRANAGGAAQPNANAKVLTSYSIPVPPLDVQRRISSILSAYDELIENNTRRIQILEEMAQAIYREWFVEFRFPGHEGARMVDSELGPMPEGWAAGTLADLLTLQRGFDLPRQQRMSGSIPVVAATGVHGTHSTASVRGPGVVTGRSGSLGTVMYLSEDFWPLNTTLWVKEFRIATPELAYFTLKEMGLEQFNAGAAVPTLNRNDIAGYSLPVPSDWLVAQFSSIAKDMFRLKETLTRSINVLRQTRDILLPRLISGEIDVSDLDIGNAEPAA